MTNVPTEGKSGHGEVHSKDDAGTQGEDGRLQAHEPYATGSENRRLEPVLFRSLVTNSPADTLILDLRPPEWG